MLYDPTGVKKTKSLSYCYHNLVREVGALMVSCINRPALCDSLSFREDNISLLDSMWAVSHIPLSRNIITVYTKSRARAAELIVPQVT